MDTILIWIDSRHSTGPSFSPAATLNIEHVSISKDYKWIFADGFPQTRQFIPTVLAPCNTSCYFIVKADTKANAHTHTKLIDSSSDLHESNLSPRQQSSSFRSGNVSSWPQNCFPHTVSKANMINSPSDWLKKKKKINTHVPCAPSPL